MSSDDSHHQYPGQDVPVNVRAPAPIMEDELSEQQLREIYDNEEIERFLHLFSAYVTEVRLPETPPNNKTFPSPCYSASESQPQVINQPVQGNGAEVDKPSTCLPPFSTNSLSQDIAFRYLLPLLPCATPPPAFTLARLRLTTQRLYLAVQPVYIPFFVRMANLATWRDKNTSLLHCTIFWIMWYYNLLLPYLLLRIFYAFIRRKIFSHPNLQELQEHRRQVTRANEFGDQISYRLSASSSFGLKDMWRLLKANNKATKAKAKHFVQEKVGGEDSLEPTEDNHNLPLSPNEDATVLDDAKDSQDAQDFKRLGLHIMAELADLHERIKNIFIWRRPTTSRIYGFAIFLVFLTTLFLPAKYIAKLTYFVGGVSFWHVTPILAALPSTERARLPPAFVDVPTDADYAMELIAQRVAAGLEVQPAKNKKKQTYPDISNNDNLSSQGQKGEEQRQQSEERDRSFDWKKWGERAAIGKSWADESKKLVTGRQDSTMWATRSPLATHLTATSPRLDGSIENHTYPAQHTSAPGLITVTPETLIFTPLMAIDPKFVIPINDIRGVKKAGLLKGLNIRYVSEPPDGGEKVEREEKFRWVGGRDELFARLVGSSGRRWLNVR